MPVLSLNNRKMISSAYFFVRGLSVRPLHPFGRVYYSGLVFSPCRYDSFSSVLSGLVDLILVKSISRLSRNTVDLLVVVRELKLIGVEVFFEKESLSSFDPKCEMLLSILASLAQEESHNLSENIKWGILRKMENGISPCPMPDS